MTKKDTLAYDAARKWDARGLAAAIAAGANPRRTEDDGRTLLYFAATRPLQPGREVPDQDFADTVRLLVSHGVDINARDKEGNTALHGAAWVLTPARLSILMEAGADPSLTNHSGLTVVDLLNSMSFLNGNPAEKSVVVVRAFEARQAMDKMMQQLRPAP